MIRNHHTVTRYGVAGPSTRSKHCNMRGGKHRQPVFEEVYVEWSASSLQRFAFDKPITSVVCPSLGAYIKIFASNPGH